MPRTRLSADPSGLFLHHLVLDACRRFAASTAIVDTSCAPARRISFDEYGATVERLARGLVAAGLQPGEVLGIYLANSWEFAATCHAATLAGAIPTPLNPSYREREVRYQLEAAGAAMLVSDGAHLRGMDLSGLPCLRRVFLTRDPEGVAGEGFARLLAPATAVLPQSTAPPEQALAALPFSSGTTGLPKGVMLSHTNLVANLFQLHRPDEANTLVPGDVVLCFLPMYHIYGLEVVLNWTLVSGATLVLMPRFDCVQALQSLRSEGVTFVPLVPPVMNAFCQAAEQGLFPTDHRVRFTKSGAAPLAPDLARRYRELTGIPISQGYGMTEASPVTHIGYIDPARYRPDSIGQPVAATECRIVGEKGDDLPPGESGELVMRGPLFMRGYWKNPLATAVALRDGWYWSGDVARRDADDFFQIVDRRKEMIKFKGFPIAPAEVEAVLLEHPAVRDCGVIGRQETSCGEIPCAFVVLRDGRPGDARMKDELCTWVADRLVGYKQPREVHFVASIPRNPSGKILRRSLRDLL